MSAQVKSEHTGTHTHTQTRNIQNDYNAISQGNRQHMFMFQGEELHLEPHATAPGGRLTLPQMSHVFHI